MAKQSMFTKYESHYLNVPKVGTFTAHDDFQCILECLKNPLCLSINVAASRRPDGKIWCELLSSDIHSNAKDYMENKQSHHFSNMVCFSPIFSLWCLYCVVFWMNEQSSDRTIERKNERTNERKNQLTNQRAYQRTREWASDWVSEWGSEWVNEWVSE